MLLTPMHQLYISIWKVHHHFSKSSGEEVWIFIHTQKEVVIDFMNSWNMIGLKYVISTALTHRFKASDEMWSCKLPMVKTEKNSTVLKYIQLYISYLHASTAAFSVNLVTVRLLFFHYYFPSLWDMTLNKLCCCLYS